MSRNRTLKQRIAKLPARRRGAIHDRASSLIAEELSLRDLRKALALTQADVAAVLNVRQDTVSRYEQRADMLLSTLKDYVRAMGGELELVARFPDRSPVSIKALGDLRSVSR